MSGNCWGYRRGLILVLCFLLLVFFVPSTGLARLAKTHGVIDVFVCELEPQHGICTAQAGVYVYIETPGAGDNLIRAVSDLDGRARFEVKAGEGYRLKTACAPYLPESVEEITVSEQMVTSLEVELQRDYGRVGDLRVIPPPGPALNALSGARVEVEMVDESVVWVHPLVRGLDGAFFAHLPADRLYQVRVRRPGHAAAETAQVQILIGEVTQITMALESSEIHPPVR